MITFEFIEKAPENGLFTDQLVDAAWGFASELVQRVGEQFIKESAKGVSPGYGPGPHPHRVGSTHIDTGYWESHIVFDTFSSSGDVTTATVGVFDGDEGYATFNELGWVTKRHNIVRYPILTPIGIKVYGESGKIVAELAHKYFEGSLFTGKLKTRGTYAMRPSRISGTYKFRKTYRPYNR